MTTEYRIICTMTFANAADRDAWYDKLRTAILAAKPSASAYKEAHLTKDDYTVPSRVTEAI